jgi:hypothetical protein
VSVIVDDTAGGVLAFATMRNTPGRHDADEFQRRGEAFVRMHGGRLMLFDDSQPMLRRASDVLRTLDEYGGRRLVCVAFFCHGWARGIEAGFDLRPRMGMSATVLATAIAAKATRAVIVPLYCCSTAHGPGPDEAPGGDGGFADQLRDALCRVGCVDNRVVAHDTDGHTTRNPRARFFEGEGQPEGAIGGRWIVHPSDPLFPIWRRWLTQDDNDLWFPFLDRAAILREITK